MDTETPEMSEVQSVKSPLAHISKLAAQLSRIAAEPDAWKEFHIIGEGRVMVIDRIESEIQRYVQEAEKQAYDQFWAKRSEVSRRLDVENVLYQILLQAPTEEPTHFDFQRNYSLAYALYAAGQLARKALMAGDKKPE